MAGARLGRGKKKSPQAADGAADPAREIHGAPQTNPAGTKLRLLSSSRATRPGSSETRGRGISLCRRETPPLPVTPQFPPRPFLPQYIKGGGGSGFLHFPAEQGRRGWFLAWLPGGWGGGVPSGGAARHFAMEMRKRVTLELRGKMLAEVRPPWVRGSPPPYPPHSCTHLCPAGMLEARAGGLPSWIGGGGGVRGV